MISALPEVNVLLQPLITTAGLDVILRCSIRAVPPAIEVYWQRNTNDHQTIIKSSSLNINGSTVGDPSLTIRKASVSMSGEYTCIARNSVGTGKSLHTILKGKILLQMLILLLLLMLLIRRIKLRMCLLLLTKLS